MYLPSVGLFEERLPPSMVGAGASLDVALVGSLVLSKLAGRAEGLSPE